MKTEELFAKIFRDTEAEMGTRDLDIMVLKALKDTVEGLTIKNSKEFCDQFHKLVEIVSSTEPKFAIVIYHLSQLQEAYFKDAEKNKAGWRKRAVKKIEGFLEEARTRKTKLLKNADTIEVEGKTILIHDHSHTVQDVLKHFKREGKHFRVIIAEQDFEKTNANIEAMHKNQIPFQVVPAYMLSHMYEDVDMLFFGAVTLKDNMQFVMDPGTHGVISEFNLEKKPTYMFMDSSKFSLWKSKKKTEVFMHVHQRQHQTKPIIYERIKYSHDRVELSLFEKIITEEGIFSTTEIKKLFSGRLAEQERLANLLKDHSHHDDSC